MNQLVEKDDSLTTQRVHTHGATPVEGIGSIIVTNRKTGNGDEFQYPHYDHRGSLFDLEDTEAGVSLAAEYNAFGEEISRSGSAATRFGYQGTAWMRHDSGLLVSPTRLYVPERGAFSQEDPLPLLLTRGSLGVFESRPYDARVGRILKKDLLWFSSGYAYVRDRPIAATDPLGLRTVWIPSPGPTLGLIRVDCPYEGKKPTITKSGGCGPADALVRPKDPRVKKCEKNAAAALNDPELKNLVAWARAKDKCRGLVISHTSRCCVRRCSKVTGFLACRHSEVIPVCQQYHQYQDHAQARVDPYNAVVLGRSSAAGKDFGHEAASCLAS
jgi:hypothetical protein